MPVDALFTLKAEDPCLLNDSRVEFYRKLSNTWVVHRLLKTSFTHLASCEARGSKDHPSRFFCLQQSFKLEGCRVPWARYSLAHFDAVPHPSCITEGTCWQLGSAECYLMRVLYKHFFQVEWENEEGWGINEGKDIKRIDIRQGAKIMQFEGKGRDSWSRIPDITDPCKHTAQLGSLVKIMGMP